MRASTPATAIISIKLSPRRALALVAGLLLICSGAHAETPRNVTVTFHTQPGHVSVYHQTLQNFSQLEVDAEGQGTLEFPEKLAEENTATTVRFSVPIWSGLYPDWDRATPEQRQKFDEQGFGLRVKYLEARDNKTVPTDGTTHKLPLPASIAFQAWTLRHPLASILIPLFSLASLALLATRGRALAARLAGAPPPAQPEPSLVAGYTIGDKLGEGGMGEVWAATSYDGLECALKILRPELAGEEAFRIRLEREVEAWKTLQHPNLLRLFAFELARDGRLVTVAELLKGQTLKALILSQKFDPPQLASRVLTQVGDALSYLHQRKLVHRDVKPDNIFVCSHGGLKLMDMGLLRDSATIAKFAEVTKTGEILGTPAYMPPEQLGTATRISGAADQYSLGIILYEILAGQRPFIQPEPILLAYQHAHAAPPPPSELDPRITPDVEQALLRMLAKAPEERFASVEAAQEALHGLRALSWDGPRKSD